LIGEDRDVTAQQRMSGDVAVLVVAAGDGVWAGPGSPGALRELAGEPLVAHAARRVVSAPSVGALVVAAPPDAVADVCALLGPLGSFGAVKVVAGGATRQASVAAALAAAPPEFDIILVHDAARALAPVALLERVVAGVRAGLGAVIPVLPVVDTIKQVDASGHVVSTADRSVLRLVQTPQGFRRDVLAVAYLAAVDELTDDAGLAEKIGVPVWTVPGDAAAMKITHSLDMRIAELLLEYSFSAD
jgi:2-C-methyl-D-erythritol 4-phosphate cytidylyltransferase